MLSRKGKVNITRNLFSKFPCHWTLSPSGITCRPRCPTSLMCAFPVYQSALIHAIPKHQHMTYTHIYIYIYYTLIYIYIYKLYTYIYVCVRYMIHLLIYIYIYHTCIYIYIISINWPSEKTPHQRLDVVWNPLHKVGGILVLHVQHLLIDLEFVPHDDTEDSRRGRKGMITN